MSTTKQGILNSSGFCIPKATLTKQQIHKIKTELSVSPESTFGNFQVPTFKVYSETAEMFIVPLYFAIENLKIEPEEFDFPENSYINESIPQDSISLRENQQKCYNNVLEAYTNKDYGGGIIQLETGMGKCLAKDTEVLMFDGTKRKVQDLFQGDLLMGDDNTPRTILTMTRGQGKMYDIIPANNGPRFTVNKQHILVLKNSIKTPQIFTRKERFNVVWWENNSQTNKLFKTMEEAEIHARTIEHQLYSELSVSDFLKTSRAFRNTFRSYRVATEFPHKELSENDMVLDYTKSVPQNVKINSIKSRTEYIYRVLQDRGNFEEDSFKLSFDAITEIDFMNDFLEMNWGIGLYTFSYKNKDIFLMSVKGNLSMFNDLGDFYCEKNYKDWSMYIVKLKFRERGEYYGFTLDSNRRFLFYDYTVSHNTVLSIKLITKSRMKTLVIVNKIELLKQWTNEIKKWIPQAKIGIIQGSKFDIEGCDIVIGMLQTISLKKEITFEKFNFCSMCIIDEVHNVSSEVFSQVMLKVRPRFLYGLTATLERKDKLEKIIRWYLGDTLYDTNKFKQLKQTSNIYTLDYYGKSSVEKTLKDGTAAVSSMLSNIAEDKERNDYIVKVITDLLNESGDRNILVASDRIAQLKYLYKNLGPELSGLFIGSMKSLELEKSKEKRVLLGTYALVSEGFNHPKLNCLVFATPRSNITQAVGRIYRKSHNNVTPVIIDICDTFSIFKGQKYRRKKIYQKSIDDCCILSSRLENFSLGNKVVSFPDQEEFNESGCCLLFDD
jgi:superfamily II DNA or RNA helicase